ncbi:MAG: bifunctional riboflavin kinase/FAD synthetase [Phycisphaerae bacterium]|nr:bifunctional riboflavin kinase/FAD synthetase [Phycisphaerae bacterium]
MRIIDSAAALEAIEKGWALTIGNFDGVHQGHRDIIAAGLDAARTHGLTGLAVMTFDPHPAAVLRPDHAPGMLTPLVLKKHLLAELGVHCLIILKDSMSLLNLSPADFVDTFLMNTVAPRAVIEGPDFTFGYGRSGTVQDLRQLGADRSFDVVVVPPRRVTIGGEPCICSSSLIRRLIAEADVAAAAHALGRRYRLIGRTHPGRGIGRQLGFPTANIEPLEQIVPAEGVYAGFVLTGPTPEAVCGPTHARPAAFSIGRAKTFLTDHPLLIEAHILEPDVEDLTNTWLAMDFVQKIRHQQRFESHEALKEQIAKDCARARQILAAVKSE